jgi:hypothetical protein
MTCTKCSNGMWVDPDGKEKPGFVWCHTYYGWMSNNGFCNQDDTGKRGVSRNDL